MRQSAENILVMEEGVVVCGRGGDLCKFVNSDEEIQLEDKTIGMPGVSPAMMQILQNMGLNHHFGFLGDLDEDDMDFDIPDLDEEW